jgi:nucleotide-binding universal stress UspA family protein
MDIHSILVPLDGSDLAEYALPAAGYFSRLRGADVILFHVIEKGAPERIHGSRHLTRVAEAETYLAEAGARFLQRRNVRECHVHKAAVRDVAASIAEHAREMKADLIVLCAHGSGGPRDWLLGSIPQQVIGRCPVPVLLLRPAEQPQPGASFELRSILLAVDTDPAHEPSREPAVELAQESGAALHLAMAVPTPGTLSGASAAAGRLLPGSTAALLELSEEEAHAYLDGMLEEIRSRGVRADAQVLRGDPAEELAALSRGRNDDLIVMGTHGKAGSAAFWDRSVAARVLAKTKLPALLIPLRE